MSTSPTFTLPQRRLTWLVTGCSSGFGLSLVRIAQANGHMVIATSRNPSKTPDLVAEVEAKGGKWVQLDVDSLTSFRLIEELDQSGYHIDILVNNAGFCTFSPIETSKEEDARGQMESMYFGPLRLIRSVLPPMRSRGYGVIVNFSSGAALDGNPSMGLYAGAKAGLDAATKVLAKEVLAFNIRCLTVVLGTFNTSFGDNAVFNSQVPDAYKGSFADKMMAAISGGAFTPNGDKDKAMQAVYDVVVGTGPGAGLEAETFLPLGVDMTTRIRSVKAQLDHALEVFGTITDGVRRDS
ncbi:putative short-chain oxidoreductase [Thozetella sp. PMI_491]|nr:putative short-chain oxidoreductase [Thozetella sp. PMI_491]